MKYRNQKKPNRSKGRRHNHKSQLIMKKFIMNLLGIEATAKNIRGKKSSGIEDSQYFNHWRTFDNPTGDNAN